MKAILEFDFDAFGDRDEHKYAVSGSKYRSIIWNLKEKLFHELDEGEHSAEVMGTYQKIYDLLVEKISDYDLSDDFQVA